MHIHAQTHTRRNQEEEEGGRNETEEEGGRK